MIELELKKEILDKASRTVTDYTTKPLEGPMNYKFQTRAFLEIVFLYIHGVDVRNPDLLGPNNRNTFIYEARSEIEKIKEQIRLDLVDLNFQVPGASTLARFIPKGANRKMLDDNEFADDLDDIIDNAADFGSGFLKIWEVGNQLNMRSMDPFYMIFNQYNFKDGPKLERIPKRIKDIIANKKYDQDSRNALAGKTKPDEMDKEIDLHQMVEDNEDGSQRISIVDIEGEEVFYTYESKTKKVHYFKFDRKKRKGFKDALGIGYNEEIFNRLVTSKVNRERLDRVMEVATINAFQKEMDHERDSYVGKDIVKLKPSTILGHKGNKIEKLDTGGIKEAALIYDQLGEIIAAVGTDLNVGDALQGNTLPSGTSGALGNLLTENQSSVHKEVQKAYANFWDSVYRAVITGYILRIFDSSENLKDYLDPNDIKLIEKNVINYLVAQKQIDAGINEEPFNLGLALEEVKRDIKDRPLISGELLEKLREEVKGIRTYITGEKVSKAKSVAFLRELRTKYEVNPDLFRDPFFVSMIKKEAEYEAGIEPIEIDNLLAELT